jgi:hypothetical protein
MAIADMNGDGHADVVLGNQQAPGAVLINDGTGRRFTLVRFGDKQGTVYGLALGDVNGDGSPDIVAARSDAPSMLYLNSLVMKAGPRSPVQHNRESGVRHAAEQSLAAEGAIACFSSNLSFSWNADRASQLKASVRC